MRRLKSRCSSIKIAVNGGQSTRTLHDAQHKAFDVGARQVCGADANADAD